MRRTALSLACRNLVALEAGELAEPCVIHARLETDPLKPSVEFQLVEQQPRRVDH